jgi:hypothetical protein
MIYFKNFCKCLSVPQHNNKKTQLKKENKTHTHTHTHTHRRLRDRKREREVNGRNEVKPDGWEKITTGLLLMSPVNMVQDPAMCQASPPETWGIPLRSWLTLGPLGTACALVGSVSCSSDF